MAGTNNSIDSLLRPLVEQYRNGALNTMEALVPFFKTRGEICSLEEFPAFEPALDIKQPPRTVFRTSRQVGKSHNAIALPGLITPLFIPGFRNMIVSPRFSQVQALANETFTPLIKNCLFKNLLLDSESTNTQLVKSLRYDARLIFTFAYLDCERVRGWSADKLSIDEVQDIQWEFLPVLEQVISRSEHEMTVYTGTPKTEENVIEWLWDRSSKAVWVTRCQACNKDNYARTDMDLLKMIGKETVVCAGCGKPVDPAYNGRYIHEHPERRWEFQGYTTSQPIQPFHYRSERKWRELKRKMRDYPEPDLYNEVFGESKSTAAKLLTPSQLKAVSIGGSNDLKTAIRLAKKVSVKAMGIDWGGGGNNETGEISYPAVVVNALLPGQGDTQQTLYAERMLRDTSIEETVSRILHLYRIFRPQYVAHDYGGAGNVWEFTLTGSGIPQASIVPLSYVSSPLKDVVSSQDPGPGSRACYNLDKTRSLVVLTTMLKSGKILLPELISCLEDESDMRTHILYGLTRLYLERMDRPRGHAVMSVRAEAGQSTDVENALNYAATALWLHAGGYPSVSEAMRLRMTLEQLKEFSPENPEWEGRDQEEPDK